MLRMIAFVAFATIGGMTPALCQDRAPTRQDERPTDALPSDPLDVPRWMGHAVENILSGDVSDKEGKRDRQ